MSEMNFPSSPSDGDEYRKWVYNASSGSWVLVDVESDLEDKLDSEHAWNVSEHSGIDSDLVALKLTVDSDITVVYSSLDSEHSWNVSEHNALQAEIDTKFAYDSDVIQQQIDSSLENILVIDASPSDGASNDF